MRVQVQHVFLAALVLLSSLGVLISPALALGIQRRRALSYSKGPTFEKAAYCGFNCQTALKLNSSMAEVTESIIESSEEMSTTLLPFSANEELDVINTTTPIPVRSYTEPSVGLVQFEDLTKVLNAKRKECKGLGKDQKSLTCQKLKLSSWFLQQLPKNYTEVMSSYVRLTRNFNQTRVTHERELMPETWAEKMAFRIINKFGEPVDKLLFYQYKNFTKSRELSVNIPHLLQLQVAAGMATGRIYDPGFNLKFKLPFLHEDFKVAVSTGTSLMADLGIGLIVLVSVSAPLLLLLNAVLQNMFLDDMKPVDLIKYVMSPGWKGPAGHQSSWEHSMEHFEPPSVHNAQTYGEQTVEHHHELPPIYKVHPTVLQYVKHHGPHSITHNAPHAGKNYKPASENSVHSSAEESLEHHEPLSIIRNVLRAVEQSERQYESPPVHNVDTTEEESIEHHEPPSTIRNVLQAMEQSGQEHEAPQVYGAPAGGKESIKPPELPSILHNVLQALELSGKPHKVSQRYRAHASAKDSAERYKPPPARNIHTAYYSPNRDKKSPPSLDALILRAIKTLPNFDDEANHYSQHNSNFEPILSRVEEPSAAEPDNHNGRVGEEGAEDLGSEYVIVQNGVML